jgi:DNA-binding phage protein
MATKMTMSTTKDHKSNMRKALINAALESSNLPLVESVNLILAIKKTSMSKIARKLKVSRQMPYVVLVNPRKSKRVKQALLDALGFDPWGE